MRSRILDVALIVGLVAVAGGIMWTLFNLGSSPRSAGNTSPSTPAAVAPAPTAPGSSQVTPVAPDAATGTPATPPQVAAPLAPDAVASGAAVGEPAVPAAPAPPATPAPPRVVPEGSVALERIGFSYVTGGPGACGVVLEAWVHVAVSRDLLAEYGCGAEVRVTLDDPAGGRSEVVGVIGDTMNPSFERTVNVYVAQDEDAFAYGLTAGVFAAR
jgi:hypothetical protein